jgi:hypothetical protein
MNKIFSLILLCFLNLAFSQDFSSLSNVQIYQEIDSKISKRNYLLKGAFFTVQNNPKLRYAKILGKKGWGYINVLGDEVIEAKYPHLSDFEHGLAKFQIKDSLSPQKIKFWENYLDLNGKPVNSKKYSKIIRTTDSLFIVALPGDPAISYSLDYGLLNRSGREIFSTVYRGGIYPASANHRIFAINNGKKYAFARNDGTRLTDFIFDEYTGHEKVAFGRIIGKGHYIITYKKGMDTHIIFDEKNENRQIGYVKYFEGRSVVIDDFGRIISKKYDKISSIENSTFYVASNNEIHHGILNKNGEEAIEPCSACTFSIVESNDGIVKSIYNKEKEDYERWYYDETYKLIPIANKQIDLFQNGILTYKKNEKYGAINTNGEVIIDPQFTQLYGFSKLGLAPASKMVDGIEKFGVIDTNGKIVIPFKFLSTAIDEREHNIQVRDQYDPEESYGNGRVGLYSLNGKQLLPPDYSFLSAKTNELYLGENLKKRRFEIIDFHKNTITEVPTGEARELVYYSQQQESGHSFSIREGNISYYGYKDARGNIIIPANYVDEIIFINGFSSVRNRKFEDVIIDKFGNEVGVNSIHFAK